MTSWEPIALLLANQWIYRRRHPGRYEYMAMYQGYQGHNQQYPLEEFCQMLPSVRRVIMYIKVCDAYGKEAGIGVLSE